MEPLSLRSAAITDPSMRPILDWIDSYVSWEKLDEGTPEEPGTRAYIATRAHAGDERALEALVNHNLRLVLSRACKRLGRGVPLGDLVQEGWIGLRIAAKKFDPGRGTQFSTSATWSIDQALRDAISTQGRTIRLSRYITDHLATIYIHELQGLPLSAREQAWVDRLGRTLTGNPYLSHLTVGYVEQLLRGPVSMDKDWTELNVVRRGDITHAPYGETSLATLLPASTDCDPTDRLDIETLLLEMVNGGTLTQREAWIIIRYFGLDGEGGRNYVEIACDLHSAEVRWGLAKADSRPLSRERIRQIITGAMTTIRLHVNATQPGYFVSPPAHGTLKEQRKGSRVPLSPAKVKSTESPKNRSTRHTSVNDLSQETAASRAAAPTPLRAHDSTTPRKRSSRAAKVPGCDVPYPEAI